MNSGQAVRKHGRKRQAESKALSLRLGQRSTGVVLEKNLQVYFWTTDRQRSRLIKF